MWLQGRQDAIEAKAHARDARSGKWWVRALLGMRQVLPGHALPNARIPTGTTDFHIFVIAR